MSSEVMAAALAATVLWVVSVGTFLMETPKRPTGEAWVMTLKRLPVGPPWCGPTCRSRRLLGSRNSSPAEHSCWPSSDGLRQSSPLAQRLGGRTAVCRLLIL
jgi:hypothetical protein